MVTQTIGTSVVNGETSISSWISGGMDPISVEYAKSFGIALATNGLSTSQIRNVFGEVRRIQMKGMESISFQNDVLLLKPKLAYSSARKVAKEKFRCQFFSQS